jgi:Domain of unknown function (DUF6484)
MKKRQRIVPEQVSTVIAQEPSSCVVPDREATPAFQWASIVVGRIAALRDSGEPLVDFPANTSGELVPARALVRLTAAEIGREVALTFEDGDAAKPIIMGVLPPPAPAGTHQALTVVADHEHLTITARQQLVLRCGRSSITLTAAGKVLITGEYLLSRSSGVNRIKGGSVQIN